MMVESRCMEISTKVNHYKSLLFIREHDNL